MPNAKGGKKFKRGGKKKNYVETKLIYKDVKENQLVERRERKERGKREHIHAGFDKNTVNVKKKNKKVKPGYKKRYHGKLQREKIKAIRKKGQKS